MFNLHKNFTKWAAGCTKTFGEGVKEGKEVAVKGNTDSGHSHWAGAKLREGGLGRSPIPYRMHTPRLSTRKRGLEMVIRF